jgi:hypothetical protein
MVLLPPIVWPNGASIFNCLTKWCSYLLSSTKWCFWYTGASTSNCHTKWCFYLQLSDQMVILPPIVWPNGASIFNCLTMQMVLLLPIVSLNGASTDYESIFCSLINSSSICYWLNNLQWQKIVLLPFIGWPNCSSKPLIGWTNGAKNLITAFVTF